MGITLSGARVLVAGGGSLVGSHLAAALLARDVAEVVIYDPIAFDAEDAAGEALGVQFRAHQHELRLAVPPDDEVEAVVPEEELVAHEDRVRDVVRLLDLAVSDRRSAGPVRPRRGRAGQCERVRAVSWRDR